MAWSRAKFFSTYLNVLIRHADVVGICRQIFRRSHDCKLDGSFVTERLVCPLSHRADLFDRGNAIVGNQDLQILSVSVVHAPIASGFSHVCDDGVASVCCHKILHSGRRCGSQVVAADEMRREIVFGRVAARRAIRRHAVGGHAVGRRARSGTVLWL
jgi:hypothetical protein